MFETRLWRRSVLFFGVICGLSAVLTVRAKVTTEIETGTEEKCEETGTTECIVHTHKYKKITNTADPACLVQDRKISPEGGEVYCVGDSVSYKLEETGSPDTPGTTTFKYGPCLTSGCTYRKPDESEPHGAAFPKNPTWEVKDKDEVISGGSGESASFTAAAASSGVGSSSITFKFDDGSCSAKCDEKETGDLKRGPYEAKFTVVGVVISQFTPSTTYAWADGCDIQKHQAQCNAAIIPNNTGLNIKYEIVGEKHGAQIDDAGIITPSSTEDGKIMVKAYIESKPECFDEKEFEIKARPTKIKSSTASAGFPCGGKWTHTFDGTGGSLQDISIGEDVGFGAWPFENTEIETGQGWTLDSNGTMTDTDGYSAKGGVFLITDFFPQPGLPQVGFLNQKYSWFCPCCLEKRLVCGPSKIKWTMMEMNNDVIVRLSTDYNAAGEPFDFTYGGPAYLADLVMVPPEINANNTDKSQGTVTIMPKSREKLWFIVGDGLGCNIDIDTGVVTAGGTAGSIKIKAIDSLSSNFAEGNLTLK